MRFSFGYASGDRALQLSIALTALTLVFASTSLAEIQGSTYDFTANASGGTDISASNGSYTDPANAGFCVGPPTDCAGGAGVSGGYTFTDLTPTTAQITFSFSGSSAPFGPGGFTIDLGNFVTLDGSTITGVTYDSGNFFGGDFSNVSWNGTDAVFTGTDASGNGFNAIDGTSVVFDVSETAAAPEPASLLLSGLGLAGLMIAGIRRKRNA